MSTKCTVAYGSDFHLYREVFDEESIYLELEGVAFEATPERVVVPIPMHIWELIRRYPGADFSYAAVSDEALLAYVTREVEARIHEYEQAPEEQKRFISMLGLIPFGRADDAREEQIESGVAYFQKMRERQRNTQRALWELEEQNAQKGLTPEAARDLA